MKSYGCSSVVIEDFNTIYNLPQALAASSTDANAVYNALTLTDVGKAVQANTSIVPNRPTSLRLHS